MAHRRGHNAGSARGTQPRGRMRVPRHSSPSPPASRESQIDSARRREDAGPVSAAALWARMARRASPAFPVDQGLVCPEYPERPACQGSACPEYPERPAYQGSACPEYPERPACQGSACREYLALPAHQGSVCREYPERPARSPRVMVPFAPMRNCLQLNWPLGQQS